MKKTQTSKDGTIVYRTGSGVVKLRADFGEQELWATQTQIASLFAVKVPAISKHLRNIYREGELSDKATVSKMETVQTEGGRHVLRQVEYYNLDAIIAVGYRISSVTGTRFRQWATKVLHQHITAGYTMDRARLAKNYDAFLKAVDDVKRVLPAGGTMDAGSAVELVKMFAETWLSLSAYDKAELPKTGSIKKRVKLTAGELSTALSDLKKSLITEDDDVELFGKERAKDSVAGIVGNVFQAFGGQELYPTVEEKAAHLLYFMVKNHPFADGNKRSGAFSFVWFLKRAGALDISRMSPEALTALTLLVAESNPKDKNRVIGLVLAMI